MKLTTLFLTLICLLSFLVTDNVVAASEKQLYSQGVHAARCGEFDKAFMSFHSLLNAVAPPVRYEAQALFALGEFYFSQQAYTDAYRIFARYLEDFNDRENQPFALAYLLKLNRNEGNTKQCEMLKKNIIRNKQLSLVFSEKDGLTYRSPMNRSYRADYYIDKVEFYVDGQLFEKIDF